MVTKGSYQANLKKTFCCILASALLIMHVYVKESRWTPQPHPPKIISKIKSKPERSLTENFLSWGNLTMEMPFPVDSGMAAKSLEEHYKHNSSSDRSLGLKLACSVPQWVPFKSHNNQEKVAKNCCCTVTLFLCSSGTLSPNPSPNATFNNESWRLARAEEPWRSVSLFLSMNPILFFSLLSKSVLEASIPLTQSIQASIKKKEIFSFHGQRFCAV